MMNTNPHSYIYRDLFIDAFNGSLPFFPRFFPRCQMQVDSVSSMWTASAPGSKVCKPDARSGVHWNFHTGVAEERMTSRMTYRI